MPDMSAVLITAATSAVVSWCIAWWFARSSRVSGVVNTRLLQVWSDDDHVSADISGHGVWLYDKTGGAMPRLQLSPSGIALYGPGEHIGPGVDLEDNEAHHVLRAEFGIDDGTATLRLWDHYDPTEWPKQHPSVEIRAGRHGHTSLKLGRGPEIKIARDGAVQMAGWPLASDHTGSDLPGSR